MSQQFDDENGPLHQSSRMPSTEIDQQMIGQKRTIPRLPKPSRVRRFS